MIYKIPDSISHHENLNFKPQLHTTKNKQTENNEHFSKSLSTQFTGFNEIKPLAKKKYNIQSPNNKSIVKIFFNERAMRRHQQKYKSFEAKPSWLESSNFYYGSDIFNLKLNNNVAIKSTGRITTKEIKTLRGITRINQQYSYAVEPVDTIRKLGKKENVKKDLKVQSINGKKHGLVGNFFGSYSTKCSTTKNVKTNIKKGYFL